MVSHLKAALALSTVLAVAPQVQAAPSGKRQATEVPAADGALRLSLEEISVMLASANADEVRMAIEASAVLGSRDVSPLLAERVRAGLPPELLDAALDVFAVLNDPQTGDVLSELSRHRRVSVRQRAVRALAALKRPEYEPVLVRALSDSDAQVREAAAVGLGELPKSTSFEALFRAFDRGVNHAGHALGKVASESQVPRFLEILGRVPLTSLIPVFDGLLSRRDLSEATKLRLVAALAELGTSEARGYLEGIMQKLPSDTPARVRKAVAEAAARIAQ